MDVETFITLPHRDWIWRISCSAITGVGRNGVLKSARSAALDLTRFDMELVLTALSSARDMWHITPLEQEEGKQHVRGQIFLVTCFHPTY